MASPAAQEEQLLELLLQLKVRALTVSCSVPPQLVQKTTPEQARVILNAQPQIAYALMALMVNLNAINMEVTQVRDSFRLAEFFRSLSCRERWLRLVQVVHQLLPQYQHQHQRQCRPPFMHLQSHRLDPTCLSSPCRPSLHT